MTKLVIGIDFSKKTMNFCCLCESVDRELIEGKVANSVSGCKEMLRLLRPLAKKSGANDLLFCGENTGEYSVETSEYLVSRGYRIWLENPLQIKKSCGIQREKNDRADAKMIAQYAIRFMDRFKCYVPLTDALKYLKKLLQEHRTLTEIKVKVLNTLSNLEIKSAELEKIIKDVENGLKNVDKQIRDLLRTNAEFSGTTRLAITVPGISYITLAAILLDTRVFTRFKESRSYAEHVGCVPHQHSSGTSVHWHPHVSKASNRRINSMLTQGAVSIMTRNPKMMAYREKKIRDGKDNGCIINNIRNKIIRTLFAVIRSGKPYEAGYVNSLQRESLSEMTACA